jgi:hypothetical protein
LSIWISLDELRHDLKPSLAQSRIINNEVTIMDKRTEFVESLSEQMVEWDAQIDRLKDKADRAKSGTKSEYLNAITALQLKRDEAALKLQGISPVSDGEWNDIKTGSEDVLDEVRSIFLNAITKIK